jgi:hypothetical protein
MFYMSLTFYFDPTYLLESFYSYPKASQVFAYRTLPPDKNCWGEFIFVAYVHSVEHYAFCSLLTMHSYSGSLLTYPSRLLPLAGLS